MCNEFPAAFTVDKPEDIVFVKSMNLKLLKNYSGSEYKTDLTTRECNESSLHLTPSNLCGIYELDSDGKITYCRSNYNYGISNLNENLIGGNFFEIAGFENVESFRRRVKLFSQSSNSTEDFSFDCRFSESVSKVKVRLVRISEREPERSSKMVIVDIRKV